LNFLEKSLNLLIHGLECPWKVLEFNSPDMYEPCI
jgi:hypothetical protein